MNVEFLVQIDKLVQLIESPIFTCEYNIYYRGTITLNKQLMHSKF